MAFEALYFTGFEMGTVPVTASQWSDPSGTEGISTTSYTGTYSYELLANATGNDYIYFDEGISSPTELYFSCYTRTANDTTQKIGFILDDGSEIILQYDNTNDTWDLNLGGTVTNGTETKAHNTWHNINVHLIVSGAGLVQTKIDGTTDILYYGDTALGTGTSIDRIRFYTDHRLNGSWFIDDVIYGTGGWPGAVRIKGYSVDGDTATDNFEKSTGTAAYALVDEKPASTSDYIYADADGEQVIMTLADFVETGITPLSVNLWAYAQKTTANADKLAFISQENGGTNQTVHSQQSLSNGTWNYINEVLNTAPDGGFWTDTKLDNLEMGFDAEIV